MSCKDDRSTQSVLMGVQAHWDLGYGNLWQLGLTGNAPVQ